MKTKKKTVENRKKSADKVTFYRKKRKSIKKTKN